MSEALYLDDVVEAGAVHAGCGAWSVFAAGLFLIIVGGLYTGLVTATESGAVAAAMVGAAGAPHTTGTCCSTCCNMVIVLRHS